jgi:putative phage-type endonuclease
MDLKLIEKEVIKSLKSKEDHFVKDNFDELINNIVNEFQSKHKDLDYEIKSLNKVIGFIIKNKLKRVYILKDDDKKINYKILIAELNAGSEYIYPNSEYKKKYLKICKRIKELKAKPQPEQRSDEWFKMRKQCITATAVAAVIYEDKNKMPFEVLLEKCGRETPFIENKFVHHGKKYEPIATLFYSHLKNINVFEYGLLIHDEITHLGASPDGICEKKCLNNTSNLSKIVGRLLEIKCPYSREIIHEGVIDGEICPHYYWVQVQVQEEVCNLDECDFLQCNISEYESFEQFEEDTDKIFDYKSKTTQMEKGAIIQLFPRNPKPYKNIYELIYQAKYLYPPSLRLNIKETKEWIIETLMNLKDYECNEGSNKFKGKDYYFDRVIYWKLNEMNCSLIKRDKVWFQEKEPIIEQFWNYVLFYRENDKLLGELLDYIKTFNIKKSDMASIFNKVHEQYMISNPKCKLKPLYQVNKLKEIYVIKKKETDNKYFDNCLLDDF